MNENWFSDCETVQDVLLSYYPAATQNPGLWDELEVDAIARIAELMPRRVDAAGRERVREIVSGWVDGMQCHAVTDRIIDALGWTEAEPDCGDCGDCGQCCPPDPPAAD